MPLNATKCHKTLQSGSVSPLESPKTLHEFNALWGVAGNMLVVQGHIPQSLQASPKRIILLRAHVIRGHSGIPRVVQARRWAVRGPRGRDKAPLSLHFAHHSSSHRFFFLGGDFSGQCFFFPFSLLYLKNGTKMSVRIITFAIRLGMIRPTKCYYCLGQGKKGIGQKTLSWMPLGYDEGIVIYNTSHCFHAMHSANDTTLLKYLRGHNTSGPVDKLNAGRQIVWYIYPPCFFS